MLAKTLFLVAMTASAVTAIQAAEAAGVAGFARGFAAAPAVASLVARAPGETPQFSRTDRCPVGPAGCAALDVHVAAAPLSENAQQFAARRDSDAVVVDRSIVTGTVLAASPLVAFDIQAGFAFSLFDTSRFDSPMPKFQLSGGAASMDARTFLTAEF